MDKTTSCEAWVMNFLLGIEAAGAHAPTSTMQQVIDELQSLRIALADCHTDPGAPAHRNHDMAERRLAEINRIVKGARL